MTTPSDFGLRSDPPPHPELLDDLRLGFIDERLVDQDVCTGESCFRALTSSSSDAPARLPCERDPQNQLLWRFNRQRLDFESMRDSVLAVSGTLDTTQGGRRSSLNEAAAVPPRRTVYGFIDRQNLDGVYRTFDFAVPDATSPKRFVTTVPQQALFLMNSPFMQEQAKRLASADS